MLSLFKDAALTLPLSYAVAKQFLFPLDGGTRTTSLWLGDATPGTFYSSSSNIIVSVWGSITNPPDPLVQVSFKLPSADTFGLPSVPMILPVSSIYGGAGSAIEINVQVVVQPGPQQEITGVQINTSQMTDQSGNVVSATAALDLIQIENGLSQRLHLLPTTRAVSPTLPGFVYNQYRWRDQSTINAIPLIPQRWDPNVSAIGNTAFTYGIGDRDDLNLVDIEEPSGSNSIYPRIQHGTFWNYYTRYWYPSSGYVLEFLPVGIGDQSIASQPTYTLQQTPRELTPVFVGTWAADGDGFFDTNIGYRYMPSGFDTSNCPPYNGYQFMLDRRSKTLTLNQGLPNGQVLVGITSGEDQDYFDLPLHPIAKITSAWASNPTTGSNTNITYTFNQQNGTITTGAVVHNGSNQQGLSVWVGYEPAVAVLYETSTANDMLVDDGSIELNPAFSGVANGYLYLQTRKRRPGSILLVADKPVIAELSASLISNTEAYGPVYYQNDYALLTATVYEFSPWATATLPVVNPVGLTGGPVIQTSETVPSVKMLVVPGPGWFGLINYQDPSQEQVFVTSGGDGKANMIYLPTSDFGQWLPIDGTGSNTLTLATPVPWGDIWSETSQSWQVSTYLVYNNNPYYGQVPTAAPRGRQGNGYTSVINSAFQMSDNYGSPIIYNAGAMSMHFWFKPSAVPQVSAQDSYEFGALGADGYPKMMFRWNTADTSNPAAVVVSQSSTLILSPDSPSYEDCSTMNIPIPQGSWPGPGAWCDVAVVSPDGLTFDVYINGIQVASQTLTEYPYAQFLTFVALSMDGYSGFSSDSIADPAFWTCELSEQDIANLAGGANATNIEPNNLASYWVFQGINPEIDYSYSENDGITTGATSIAGPVALNSMPLPLIPTQPPNLGGRHIYASLTSNPESIQPPASSILTWLTYNHETQEFGTVAGGQASALPVASSGSIEVTPNQSTTYGLWAGSEIMKARVMVPFAPETTPGAPEYSLGIGFRVMWKYQGQQVFPLYAIDDQGHRNTDPRFDGNVAQLVYPNTLPNDAYIAAYYVDYAKTVSLMLQVADNPNVNSNVIYIQMGPPLAVDENPFLILQDQVQGRLGLYRLGGGWPTGFSIPSQALI